MSLLKTKLHAASAALLLATGIPSAAMASSLPVIGEQAAMLKMPPEFSPFIMGGAGYKEEYLARVLAQFRMHAGEDQIIDRKDSEIREAIQSAQRRASTISRFIALDLDQDGAVTPVEIDVVYSANGGNNSALLARMDGDRDGSITQREWEAGSAAAPHSFSGSRADSALEVYLALDPNSDDTMTAPELRSVATALFDRFDMDGDGNLSREEARAWSKAGVEALRSQRRAAATPEVMKTWTKQGRQNAEVIPLRLPPVPELVNGPASVTIQTQNGASADAGFTVKGDGAAAQGRDRTFVVKQTGGGGKLLKVFAFETGRNFKLTSVDCDTLETEGSCEIKAAMTASYNGVFKDKLLVKVGEASASIAVTGLASGWPDADLVWDGQTAQLMSSGAVPRSNLLRVTGDRSESRIFRLSNKGAGRAPPPELSISDITGQAKEGWSVAIDEACASQGIAPEGVCDVTVQAKPKWDGQSNAVIMISRGDRGDPRKTLILGAIAKGVAGRLPEGVVGNGDACPTPGAAAEVAVSSTEGFRANDGYFTTGRYGGGYNDGSGDFQVVTAGCDNWQRDDHDGKLSCRVENSGGHHSSTMRRYEAKTVEGPWTPTELTPGHISARLDCRDGLIETIEWTW